MNYVMAGLNNELIYPIGLTTGLYQIAFTDSEKSSIIVVTFRIDAAPGIIIVCTPPVPVLSLAVGTVSAVLSAGTPPYYLMDVENRSGISGQDVFHVVLSGVDNADVTITPGTAYQIGQKYWIDFVDSSGTNILRTWVLVTA